MVSEGGRSAGANLYTAFRRPPLVAGATTFLHGKACHWILARLLAPYESSSLATGGSVSLDSQSPKGSLRIQFPCHPAKAVGLWALGSGVHLRVEQ